MHLWLIGASFKEFRRCIDGTLTFETVDKHPFPLPHYCGICDLPGFDSAAQRSDSHARKCTSDTRGVDRCRNTCRPLHRLGKWKWLFANSCEFKIAISFAKGFFFTLVPSGINLGGGFMLKEMALQWNKSVL
jgi:hypothetical protein